MVFSKEDKVAWKSSETMREFEKLAGEILNPNPEAYMPIEETGPSWEEESFEEDYSPKECQCTVDTSSLYDGKICSECGGLKNASMQEEMQEAFAKSIIENLQKLASNIAEKSNIKVAYRIEQTVEELKNIIREGKNE